MQPLPFKLPYVVDKDLGKLACFSCSPLQCVPVYSSRLAHYVCNSYFCLMLLFSFFSRAVSKGRSDLIFSLWCLWDCFLATSFLDSFNFFWKLKNFFQFQKCVPGHFEQFWYFYTPILGLKTDMKMPHPGFWLKHPVDFTSF